MLNIDTDLGRFRQIVKGRVRKDLRKYMSTGELIGRQGGKNVSIPMPEIGIPRFRFGENGKGMGQGDGDAGDDAGQGQQAGDAAGEHMLEVDFSVEELAELLAEELELPRIEPKGSKDSQSTRHQYKGISRTGPESLRHTRRTYKAALKRAVASGTFHPDKPRVVPLKDDRRYRSFKIQSEPRSSAVILYMMDVSGSMGKEQKEIVRSQAFWLDMWIRHHYENVDARYIIHDAQAKEVDRDTFFRTRESGGTLISTAYELAIQILEADYPVADWNIYPFHFSDGDNWSHADTKKCMEMLKEKLIPWSNQFSYSQVDSQYGSGQFFRELETEFPNDERVVTARVPNREAIMDSIKELLKRGA